MKKLEIYRVDSITEEEEVITLTSDYGFIGDTEAVRMLNEAEDEQYIMIKFGNASVTLMKCEFSHMIETEV